MNIFLIILNSKLETIIEKEKFHWFGILIKKIKSLGTIFLSQMWYEVIDKQWLDNRIIVHGHTPTRQLVIKRSIKELEDIPALDIDAGCVFEGFGFGHLCALNLDTKEVIFQRNIENRSTSS